MQTAEAKPFVKGNPFSRIGESIKFPFGRGLVRSIGRGVVQLVSGGAKLGFRATKEGLLFCFHAPQIVINGVISTTDVLMYECEHHFEEVKDDPKYYGAGFDGTQVKPIVQYSEAQH